MQTTPGPAQTTQKNITENGTSDRQRLTGKNSSKKRSREKKYKKTTGPEEQKTRRGMGKVPRTQKLVIIMLSLMAQSPSEATSQRKKMLALTNTGNAKNKWKGEEP